MFSDDLLVELLKSTLVLAMFFQLSHHNSMSICFTAQHYYDAASKPIRLNCNYKVFFRYVL